MHLYMFKMFILTADTYIGKSV